MTKPNSTLLAIVLDRSGSMASVVEDVIGGFDNFIAEQKKQPGECRVTFCQFDTEYENVWSDKPIAEVPSVRGIFVPRGMTALHDAVGRTINEIGAKLAAKPEHERPSQVLFVIITDGQENSSREFSKHQIANMIKDQTDAYQWSFTFLGANIDAFGEAASLSIKGSAALNYKSSKKGLHGAFKAASSAVLRSRSLGESLSYSPQERSMAMGELSDED